MLEHNLSTSPPPPAARARRGDSGGGRIYGKSSTMIRIMERDREGGFPESME